MSGFNESDFCVFFNLQSYGKKIIAVFRNKNDNTILDSDGKIKRTFRVSSTKLKERMDNIIKHGGCPDETEKAMKELSKHNLE